jgi:glycosyltransferase involved in cell wall biosynthesis
MPRSGRHPLKVTGLRDDFRPQKITIATITHIPQVAGYWSESLDVLKLFFQSLFASTEQSFDLMVFDNASCEEVQDYLLRLKKESAIQYLTLSQYNLKKLGALNHLLSTAPGDYIAFADSDVYFLPGWLEASLKILEAFPEAAKVTALPLVGGDKTILYAENVLQAQSDPSLILKTGELVEQQYIDAHRISLGKTPEQYQTYLKNRKDVLLTRNGVSAYLTGADFQFMITRQALKKALPLVVENPDEYYDPIYSPVLERRLEAAGLWHLSTPDYLVHHMGNHVPDLSVELPWLNLEPEKALEPPAQPRKSVSDSFSNRLRRNRFIRKAINKIHLWSYRFLYDS